MEKYRSTIKEIIASVAEKYEPRVYREQEEKYMLLVKNILENQRKYIRTSSVNEEVKYIYTTYVPSKAQPLPPKPQKTPLPTPPPLL